MDRTQSPAFAALPLSTKCLLLFIENEITRNGGGNVSFFADQFEVIGSRACVRPGLRRLFRLGLIEWQRFAKQDVIGLSDRWRDIHSAKQAMLVAETGGLPPIQPKNRKPAAPARLDKHV